MFVVERFLCCLKLESAGIILGWLSICGFTLATIALVAVEIFAYLLTAPSYPILSTARDFLVQQLDRLLGFVDYDVGPNSLQGYRELFAPKFNLFHNLFLCYCILMIVAGFKIVKGTKNVRTVFLYFVYCFKLFTF